MPTASAAQAWSLVRDTSHFQWYVIPFFALVVYVYANEIERKNWSLILAGLAFWGMDWFNEIWNGLFFHFTNFAPVWGTPGTSAYVILIGLNIEICLMFAISGIVWAKQLPADKKMKIFGIPNRLLVAVLGSIFCVFVEVLLNAMGMLTWEYRWWNACRPWLIFLIGYLTFFLVSFWVLDMEKMKNKLIAVGTIFAVDIISLSIFIPLGWI